MGKLDPFHQRESCTLLLPRYKDRHANLMSIGDGKQYVQVIYICQHPWPSMVFAEVSDSFGIDRMAYIVAPLILAISAAIINF